MAERIKYGVVSMAGRTQFFSVERFADGTVRIGLERRHDDSGIYFAVDMSIEDARDCGLILSEALPEETTHAG